MFPSGNRAVGCPANVGCTTGARGCDGRRDPGAVVSRCGVPWIGPRSVEWSQATTALSERGWLRLERALDIRRCQQLSGAAPSTWAPLPEVEGGVRQGGLSCGVFFRDAATAVQEFGREVCDSLSGVSRAVPPVPLFNEVQWGRSRQGVGFITRHRDPPGAGGIIVIVTLTGNAVFRVWEDGDGTEWLTEDGDVVLLRGHRWPTEDSMCPLHEVESPCAGERITMTLRHNAAGEGADYFA